MLIRSTCLILLDPFQPLSALTGGGITELTRPSDKAIVRDFFIDFSLLHFWFDF